jgi:hypothetical protein
MLKYLLVVTFALAEVISLTADNLQQVMSSHLKELEKPLKK